ncbi:MFS transporter [Acrocarpospora catenulata]|uniref:MFS transporter n=1 Tax=Acrocarpospora catenulata TaxID=2836182 RepID=UPI001BDA9DDE|nr:MFS transporter [Acrocarpospora catenulata]
MTTPTSALALTRDRPTWLAYLILAVFATYVYGLAAAVPLIRAEFNLTQAVAGLHGTGMAVGAIVIGLALPMITARYGRRAVTWAGMAGMSTGMVIVAAAPSLPFTLLGYTVASGFAAASLYIQMAVLSDHHGPAGPAAISEANAVGVIGGILSSYVFSLLADSALGWRAAMLIPVVLSALLAVTMSKVWVPAREPDTITPPSPGRMPYSWRFHLAGVVLMCCVATEFAYTMWSAEVLSQRTGLSVATATTGITAMLAGMAVGRFAGARLTLRFPVHLVLVGALLLAMSGWALFWSSTVIWLAYAGLALSGLGMSMHFPLSLSRVIDSSDGRPDQASGAASIWAGVGSGAGPLVLGALGDGFGTHTAFLLAPALMGLAIGGILSSRRPSG